MQSEKQTTGKRWLKVSEVAEAWGVSAKTIYRLIEDGKIPHYRLGKSIRLDIEDFRKEALHEHFDRRAN